jgi:hypothetical protein
MVVTVEAHQGLSPSSVSRRDLIVYEGLDRVPVIGWVALQGKSAGLELLLLIDNDSSSELLSQTDALDTFISAQPTTTAIAVGHLRQNSVEIVHRFTTDHSLVVEAIHRLRDSTPSYITPYSSLTDLMEHWSTSGSRREILMIANDKGLNNLSNSSVQSIIAIAQQDGIVIYFIYASYKGITPYLDDIASKLRHQYELTFLAKCAATPGFQPVRLRTELPNIRLTSPDEVYVRVRPNLMNPKSVNRSVSLRP